MEQQEYGSLVGRFADLRRTVRDADTAIRCGSGDVQVLATPALLAWLEAATVLALSGLPEQITSVGTRIELEHRRPSAVGEELVCAARVESVSGRAVRFQVQATRVGDEELVASGTVVRALVDRSRFLEGLGPAGEAADGRHGPAADGGAQPK